jgi:hypothetical protein
MVTKIKDPNNILKQCNLTMSMITKYKIGIIFLFKSRPDQIIKFTPEK